MQVRVGNVLSLEGKKYIVYRIDRHQTVRIAGESSREMDMGLEGQTNVKFLCPRNIEEFEVNTLIEMDIESVELREPGRDIQFVYTKYNVRRYKADDGNDRRPESATGQTGNKQTESSG